MNISDTFLHIEEFLSQVPENKIPLISIVGATASGKSALAVKTAQEFNGEVISVDSRQIYTDLDIGTGKVTEEEMEGVVHWGLDLATPDQQYDMMQFKKYAEEKIDDIYNRGKIPVLCGGTGLWVDAICKNFEPKENTDKQKEIRNQLEKQYEEDPYSVWDKLHDLDTERASKICVQNKHHLIRSLEMVLQNPGQTVSDLQWKNEHNYQILSIQIDWPREKLYERINLRCQMMIDQGLEEETRSVLEKFGNDCRVFDTIGYNEMRKYLQSEISKEDMLIQMQQHTRKYSKRQLTWFRRNSDIILVDGEKL